MTRILNISNGTPTRPGGAITGSLTAAVMAAAAALTYYAMPERDRGPGCRVPCGDLGGDTSTPHPLSLLQIKNHLPT
jgi:hypothetical protein